MSNLGKTYHKGKYRFGEWSKHLRPYLKKLGNKKWRKTGKHIEPEDDFVKSRKTRNLQKTIEVKITHQKSGIFKCTTRSKYRTMRDAENAMKQAHVLRAEIISKK